MSDKICNNLATPFEKKSSTDWTVYPRPQMVRDSYFSLVGEWDFISGDYSGKIHVPYPPESRISGVEINPQKNKKHFYCKTFVLEKDFIKDVTLLHFGAVDQIARVTLNGVTYPENVGGYLPFSIDVSDSIKTGENVLEVEVEDSLDTDNAYGKQTYRRGGMWYTPVSGIWQAVWLESLPKRYIKSITVTPTLDRVEIYVDGGLEKKSVTLDGKTYEFDTDSIILDIDNPVCWTPENPHLYYFTLTDGQDTVKSYFALRTVSIEKRGNRSYICLNGKPYFFHALLDQGYYSDGIYTPASPDGYLFDILEMKKQGFNTLRKHIKIEPDIFYYYCDKYGMAVFQDMVNSGEYNFIRDTALPTVGFKKLKRQGSSKKRIEAFLSDSVDTLSLLYNHPSVVYYTIFNEGWGQFDADEVYDVLKRLDTTRVFDSTSGWFSETRSDVDSHHVYFKKIKIKPNPERPQVLSEFGGYSCKIDDHSFNLSKTYGYAKCRDKESFMSSLERLYLHEIITSLENGLCAAVLTQVSDIEDETNGIVTYDRQVIKTDAEKMMAIAKEIFKKFNEITGDK